ncbi:hypothetical protein [Streptosporangium sp. NPDC002721]|uniref:hypothetical protein n=1 Tax=Streptosporangium sp. NPDC002721 TaxID=3366188 RepID=UPI00369CACB4
MMRGWRIAGGIVAGLALVVLGVLLFKAGLDDADKWASVIGVFVGLLGLILSGYGVVLSRRALQSGLQATGVQVTASGTRSIAGQAISGNVFTGDTMPVGSIEKNKTPADNAPQADPAPAADAPQTAGAAQVTVTASGERSIAAQTISGTVSTGDNATGNR